MNGGGLHDRLLHQQRRNESKKSSGWRNRAMAGRPVHTSTNGSAKMREGLTGLTGKEADF
jgi:hypothetical protein